MMKKFADRDKSFVSIEKKFTKIHYAEAYHLLKTRFKKNKINLNIIKNKNVIDIGCGEGRYSKALYKIGAKSVTCVENGSRPKNLDRKFKFISNSIFKIQSEKKYDFVFCNGRLSHIKNWKKALKQISKLKKKDGWLWLNLFGKGPNWKFVDKLRAKLNYKDAKNFENALLVRDWEPNKIFFLIDLFFSSQRIYFTKKKIKLALIKLGFKKIIFLKRGVSQDLNEKIFKKPALKKIYGEGEIRLIAK